MTIDNIFKEEKRVFYTLEKTLALWREEFKEQQHQQQQKSQNKHFKEKIYKYEFHSELLLLLLMVKRERGK